MVVWWCGGVGLNSKKMIVAKLNVSVGKNRLNKILNKNKEKKT